MFKRDEHKQKKAFKFHHLCAYNDKQGEIKSEINVM